MKQPLTLLLGIMLLFNMPARLDAQPNNIDISGGSYYEGEPFLASNPTNPQNLIIAWMGLDLTSGLVAIKTKTSFDGGYTWNNLVVHPHYAPTLHSADVSMAFRKDGVVFMTYIDDNQTIDSAVILIQQSADGGNTWSTPYLVWNADEQISKVPIDRPWLVVDNSSTANAGMLYITTKPAPFILPPNRPYFKSSADSGQTWTAYRYVDTTGYLVGNSIAAPMGAPAVTADGAVCVVYPSYLASQSLFGKFYLAKSYSRGESFNYTSVWTGGALAATDTNYKAGYRLTANPSNANQMAFAAVANIYGDADIFCSTTNDGGTTWSSLVRVNDDTINNGVGQDMVWAQYSSNGDLLFAWRDRRNAPDTGSTVPLDFYSSVSHNNGASFEKNVRLSNVTSPFYTVLSQPGNDFMSCHLDGDSVEACWGDMRNAVINIYFAKTADTSSIDSTTGIITVAQDKLFDAIVFPSPANSSFNITLQGLAKTGDVQLINENGQIVFQKEKIQPTETMDCSRFSNGVYIVKIITEFGDITKPIVINK